MKNILRSTLEKRYSTKIFDPSGMADSEKIQAVIETIRLAPSSMNCQPWHVFVITSKAEKERLSQCAWEHNKPKYTGASHLFIFCRKDDYTAEDIEEVLALIDTVRQKDSAAKQRQKMQAYILNAKDKRQRAEWMEKQVYLMLGQFLTSCALLEVDACPIEGFLPQQMDQLLDLEEKGLRSVVSAVVGKGSIDDFNRIDKAPKVRFNQDDIVTLIP